MEIVFIILLVYMKLSYSISRELFHPLVIYIHRYLISANAIYLLDFLDIVDGVLQGDKLASYLFIIYLDYLLQTSIDLIKENSFMLKKTRTRRYLSETIADADYADDMAFLANAPAQAESQLHSLEKAAESISLYVNSNKTKYMCFNREGAISTLDGRSLKLVDKLM